MLRNQHEKNMRDRLSELNQALNDSDVSKIKSLLSNYPELEKTPLQKNGEMLIHQIVRKNNLSLLKELIEECKLDINLKVNDRHAQSYEMTPVFLASSLPTVDSKILEYLLAQGGDPSVFTTQGRTPLASAVYFKLTDKIKVLISSEKNLSINSVMDKGHTVLINAIEGDDIEDGDCEIVRLIFSIKHTVSTINHKRHNGESALFIAAKKGDVKKVELLILIPEIDLVAKRNSDGKTAIQIAQYHGYHSISNLIFTELKIRGDNDPSYERYARTLRKVMTDELYLTYLTEQNKEVKYIGTTIMTQKEKTSTKTRKLWTDIVSKTFQENQSEARKQDIKWKIIERIKTYSNNPEELYHSCITYLKNQSVITVTFDASFLNKKLTDFQLLNMFERDNRSNDRYTFSRNRTEEDLFGFLPNELKKGFKDNIGARPRYGALLLLDKNTSVRNTSSYGSSFIVLKDVAKLNALFAPSDTLNYKVATGKNYTVCTWHHLEFLLWQCSNDTLSAIIKRVQNGVFPPWYNQNASYIEVLLPAINIFDPNIVEHIYIDSYSYKMEDSHIEMIRTLGINVTNSLDIPYDHLSIQLMQAVEKNEEKTVEELLTAHPSLAKISDKNGRSLVQIATMHESIDTLQFLIKLECRMLDNDSLFLYALQRGDTEKLNQFLYKNRSREMKAIYLASSSNNIPESVLLYLINKNISLSDGTTPLLLAARHNLPKKIKIISECKGVDPNHVHHKTKKSALIYAVEYSTIDAMHSILSIPGININYEYSKKRTAIYIAAEQGKLEKVNILLQAYSKNNICSEANDKNINSALQVAHENGRKETANVIARFYLSLYIEKAEKRPPKNLLNTLNIFGKQFGQYSAGEKLAAAKKLRDVMNGQQNGESLETVMGELTSGTLGLIYQSLQLDNLKIANKNVI